MQKDIKYIFMIIYIVNNSFPHFVVAVAITLSSQNLYFGFILLCLTSISNVEKQTKWQISIFIGMHYNKCEFKSV